MPLMTKRVNVNAPIAIRNITPPIHGIRNNIIMTTGDILKCICKRARVEEILPDGSTVRLNMRNYYTDNGAGLDATTYDKKEEINLVDGLVSDDFVINTTEGLASVAELVNKEVPEAPSEEAQVVETVTDDTMATYVVDQDEEVPEAPSKEAQVVETVTDNNDDTSNATSDTATTVKKTSTKKTTNTSSKKKKN